MIPNLASIGLQFVLYEGLDEHLEMVTGCFGLAKWPCLLEFGVLIPDPVVEDKFNRVVVHSDSVNIPQIEVHLVAVVYIEHHQQVHRTDEDACTGGC